MHQKVDMIQHPRTLRELLSRALHAHSPSESDELSLWLFGYGSLIWNPGFDFEHKAKARLDGYERVFWHGNREHRGTEEMPGRVVTIEPRAATAVHGLAFRAAGLPQIAAALKHLHYREIENGYDFVLVDVQLDDGQSVLALTVVADHSDADYMGPDSVESIARQIATAEGRAGPNYEYLYKLADYSRQLFPNVDDEHLFTLESAVRKLREDSLVQMEIVA